MVFVQKWPLFQTVFLGNIGKENVFYDILERKNSFLGYKNQKFKKSLNLLNPWFWSKDGCFSKPFFLGNIGQENVFSDILQRENSFLGYKNKKFKNSKIWHFFNRVNPCFWSKNGHFSKLFFFANIGQENAFYNILQRKISFLRYKIKKFKKSKNWHFCERVNPWFWSKNCHFFQLFFLGNIVKENVLYDILERKNSFLRYKRNKFKKSKNWHFYKVVNSWFLSKKDHYYNLFF